MERLFDVPATSPKAKRIPLADADRPDTKLLTYGRKALSDSDLIACIINEAGNVDLPREVLYKADNNLSKLAKCNYHELRTMGLTHTKAIRVIASFELGERRKLAELPEKLQVRCSRDIFDYLSPIFIDLDHEEFFCIYLNRSNRVLGKIQMSKGGLSGTVTDVRLILKKGIELQASGLIVAHNHPSGNLNPSESDTKITQKIKEACTIMDIQLLDHIIACERDYYSFADNGLI